MLVLYQYLSADDSFLGIFGTCLLVTDWIENSISWYLNNRIFGALYLKIFINMGVNAQIWFLGFRSTLRLFYFCLWRVCFGILRLSFNIQAVEGLMSFLFGSARVLILFVKSWKWVLRLSGAKKRVHICFGHFWCVVVYRACEMVKFVARLRP